MVKFWNSRTIAMQGLNPGMDCTKVATTMISSEEKSLPYSWQTTVSGNGSPCPAPMPFMHRESRRSITGSLACRTFRILQPMSLHLSPPHGPETFLPTQFCSLHTFPSPTWKALTVFFCQRGYQRCCALLTLGQKCRVWQFQVIGLAIFLVSPDVASWLFFHCNSLLSFYLPNISAFHPSLFLVIGLPGPSVKGKQCQSVYLYSPMHQFYWSIFLWFTSIRFCLSHFSLIRPSPSWLYPTSSSNLIPYPSYHLFSASPPGSATISFAKLHEAMSIHIRCLDCLADLVTLSVIQPMTMTPLVTTCWILKSWQNHGLS